MMASVDEGIGAILEVLERQDKLDDTFIVFLGDNGYFFGEHALGPERRFAYEEGIRSPFVVRYPRKVKAGSRQRELVICQDIAPTLIALAGGRPGPQIQGRSLLPLFAGKRAPWRKSFLVEYWAEQAMPWLVGMTYKAVRTDRYKYIHWVNRGRAGELDELYDLERDPYELANLNRSRAYAPVRDKLRRELAKLVAAERSGCTHARRCVGERQFAVAPDALTIGTQSARSSAMSLENAAGAIGGARSKPCGPSFSFASAEAKIRVELGVESRNDLRRRARRRDEAEPGVDLVALHSELVERRHGGQEAASA